MAFYSQAWFWLLILSIVAFIVVIIAFETLWRNEENTDGRHAWIIVLFIIAIVLLILAFLLYVFQIKRSHCPPKVKQEPTCPEKKLPPKELCSKIKEPCEGFVPDNEHRIETSRQNAFHQGVRVYAV